MSDFKNILITGATGALGGVVTRHFLEKGHTVIAPVRSGTTEAAHPKLKYYPANLEDENAAANFVKQAISQHGAIHAAILLAGGFAMGNLEATGSEAIRQQVSLNFETAYHVAKPVLAHMQQTGRGRIIFTGARPAIEPASGRHMVAYALSKSLLFGLAEMINAATKGSDIAAAVIVPSTIDTAANRQSMPDADFAAWVHPQSIAETLDFLVSGSGSALREAVVKLYDRS